MQPFDPELQSTWYDEDDVLRPEAVAMLREKYPPGIQVLSIACKETGQINSRYLLLRESREQGWLETLLGPFFPGERDIWLEYDREARRIGIPDADIAFAERHWADLYRCPANWSVSQDILPPA